MSAQMCAHGREWQATHLRPPVRLLVRALEAGPPALLRLPVDGNPPLRPSPQLYPRLPGVDDGNPGGDDCALNSRFLPSVLLP